MRQIQIELPIILSIFILQISCAFHFNFFLIPPLLSSPHELFSTQLGTVIAPFLLASHS